MATLELLKNWNLDFLEELDVKVQGSDERVISRKVVNTKQGKFLLEEVSFIKRKIEIAETLDYLSEKALSYVNPYLKTREGKFLCSFNSGFWQLSRYIDGWKLKRPDYLKESWRGVEAGKFLKKYSHIFQGVFKSRIACFVFLLFGSKAGLFINSF